MKNLKVRTKLVCSFGIVLLLFVATVAIGVTSVTGVKTAVEEFYNGPFKVQSIVNKMEITFEDMQKNVFHAMSTVNLTMVNSSIDTARAGIESIDTNLKSLQENYTGDKSLLDAINTGFTDVKPDLNQVMDLAALNTNEGNEQAIAFTESTIIPKIESLTEKMEQVLSESDTMANDNIDEINASISRVIVVMLIAAVFAIIASILLCLYVTRVITKPLAAVNAAMQSLSQGDLRVSLEYESRDEIGQVAASMRDTIGALQTLIRDMAYILHEMGEGNFTVVSKDHSIYRGDFTELLNSMQDIEARLNDALLQIGQSADQVASGSDQVSNSAQALSQGATEQASSVEELAATINEISAQVKENAENAVVASDKVQNVGTEVMSSNDQMKQMVGAMADISSSSNEIGKIIKTIEDIAFQTNILALNAAVEAARAGAAGKGFAVVADEVRNLASKSAEASKNTATLIESSIHSVERGTLIADETAKSLIAVVEGSKEVITIIEKISKASNDQAGSISQVTQGIDQISAVVQTNSATAEESAAASEELSGQAQLLNSLVGRFKLASGGTKKSDYQSGGYSSEDFNGGQSPKMLGGAQSPRMLGGGEYGAVDLKLDDGSKY